MEDLVSGSVEVFIEGFAAGLTAEFLRESIEEFFDTFVGGVEGDFLGEAKDACIDGSTEDRRAWSFLSLDRREARARAGDEARRGLSFLSGIL